MRQLDRHLPLVAACIGGLVSMGLEVLAARVIHPVFGSSVFIWGSILTVFMTALGIGYYVGGRRAATTASREALTRLLLNVAVLIGIIAIVTPRVLEAGLAIPLPTRYQSIPPIALLFGPPAYLVGCISPYAAELAVGERGVGDAAGRVYAAGTVGSILGAAGTTFVLLPIIGVDVSYVLFIGLLLLGGVATIGGTISRMHLLRVGVALLLLVSHVAVFTVGPSVVHETDTPYHHIEVRDDDGVRTLYLNGDPQSAEYLNGSDSYVFEYTKALHLSTTYRDTNPDTIDNVLLIGGGGGTVAERYADEYGANVDVVELDPGIAQAAHSYFNTSHENVTWHVQDGRTFLRETESQYDVIILDAFREDGVPYHLTTVEFFRLVESHLTVDGVFAANIIAAETGPESDLYHSEIATTQQAFAHVDAYPLGGTATETQNIVLIGWRGDAVSTETLNSRAERYETGVPITDFIEYRRHGSNVSTSDAQVLWDDRGATD